MSENFVTEYIESMDECEVGFDIGACTGLYTNLIADKCKLTYAFECCKATCDAYLTRKNAIIINKAISDNDYSNKMYVMNHGKDGKALSGNSIHPRIIEHDENSNGEFIRVQSITIDTFMKEYNVPRVDFIKMDIESAEDFAWNGAINTLKNNKIDILLEVHDLVDRKKLYRFFKKLDYKVYDENLKEVKKFEEFKHYLVTNNGN